MLTDAILKEAAAEAERFLLSIVPEGGEPHVFSADFERKMQKLTRRVNHPVRYRLIRVAVAAILISIMLIGAVLAVSPEAREAVARWFKGSVSSQVIYRGEDQEKKGENLLIYEYRLTFIPEGYREEAVLETSAGKVYVYKNNEDLFLNFSYSHAVDGNDVIISGLEDDQCQSVYVNGNVADIYISNKEGESNTIVWEDKQTHMLFRVHAYAGVEELIKLAESVERIE